MKRVTSKRLGVLAATIGLGVYGVASAATTTWDAVADFSLTNNPNGQWLYTWGGASTYVMVNDANFWMHESGTSYPGTDPVSGNPLSPPFEGTFWRASFANWIDSTSYYCKMHIGQADLGGFDNSDGSNPAFVGSKFQGKWDAGDLGVIPSYNRAAAEIAFVAPQAGDYVIVANVYKVGAGYNNTAWLYKRTVGTSYLDGGYTVYPITSRTDIDSKTLTSTYRTDPGNAFLYSGTVHLAAGEQLVVSYDNTKGDNWGMFGGVKEFTVTIPEPATMGLFLTGCALMRRRRSREAE